MARVVCELCKSEANPEKVEFLNIEEDDLGRDLFSFVCPMCKMDATSFIFGD